MGKSENTNSFQAGEEEDSEEDDDLSLLSRRVNQLWKKIQRNFRGSKRIGGHSESTSGPKKSGVGNDVIFFECKEPAHYKNECPRLKKDRPKKKDSRGKKKGLMATWDDFEFLEDEYDE